MEPKTISLDEAFEVSRILTHYGAPLIHARREQTLPERLLGLIDFYESELNTVKPELCRPLYQACKDTDAKVLPLALEGAFLPTEEKQEVVPEEQPIKLSGDQTKAMEKLRRFMSCSDRYFVLGGYAGTGKTTLMRLLRKEYPNIIFTAPTNKASKVLASTIGASPKTIYSLLGIGMEADDEELKLTYPSRLPEGIEGMTIAVDEASMVGKDLLAFIMRAAEDLNLKIIFIGDPAQLPPVGETRSKAFHASSEENKVFLKEVMRYDNQLLTLATGIRNAVKNKDTSLKLSRFVDNNQVKKVSSDIFETMIQKLDKQDRVIAWRNRTVDYYNDLIRASLGFNDRFCVGDVVLCAGQVRDPYGGIIANTDDEFEVTSVKKGDVIVKVPHPVEIRCDILLCEDVRLNIPTRAGSAALQAVLVELASKAKDKSTSAAQRKMLWQMFWSTKQTFHKVRYGWALTAHRSQGSTFRNVFVDASDILSSKNTAESRKCLYVASTRATDSVVLT